MMIEPMEINVLFDEGMEDSIEADWLERVAGKVLAAQGIESGVEMGLVIVGQEKIQQLNRDYLEEDEPTDVLSFAMLPEPLAQDVTPFIVPPDGVRHLGEVIIAYSQAVIQAEEHRHSVKKEVALLIIHGVLHLLGYDHDEPDSEREMKAREAAILDDIEEELQ
ncbi:MAG: rRNA maturation RNase YbeY [Dehalococcoidales bacterium]|nr:rRNA maturation RNase YbeY [Dehalococcoidales bacterium]